MSIGPFCNFCGKNRQQVKKLLAGNENTHICDNCVDLCYDIINKERVTDDQDFNPKIHKMQIPTPRELHRHLDKHVIGQEGAKKTLSVAVYNHYKRVKNSTKKRVQKSNVLLAGPTGTGKTLMAQTLAEFLEVPFVITDATVITESGYAGEDAEVLVQKLFQAADYDVERAQIGIIYVDEIDKKARRNDMVSLSRDVSGEGVQQSLLKLMEGTVVSVPNKPGHNPEKVDIDTTNILFIVGGAFVGLSDIVLQRIGKNRIGFSESHAAKKDQDWQNHLQTRDLVKYGLIPEFVGRLPSINMLQELDRDDLIKILTEPENSIVSQLKFLFSLDKVDIEFNNKALEKVADIALAQELGARGLRKILDQALLDIQYNLPELANQGVKKIIITDATISDGVKPLMIKG
jgi:ATP-dependent Clp protease ATP-binding subunit ClpX